MPPDVFYKVVGHTATDPETEHHKNIIYGNFP